MLKFTPYAFAKLLFLRDLGDTEVGGFGISDPGDLLLVRDIWVPKQECTMTTVSFDEEGIADSMMTFGEKSPEEYMRIWIHTHPKMSATPSGTDEETFKKSLGDFDWAVMYILSKTEDEYCRMRINKFGFEREIPTSIEYGAEFPSTDRDSWLREYKENVSKKSYTTSWKGSYGGGKRFSNFSNQVEDEIDSFLNESEDAFSYEESLPPWL